MTNDQLVGRSAGWAFGAHCLSLVIGHSPLVIALMRFLAVALVLALTARAVEPAAPFEILEGDRVLLLGDTLLERENIYGYLETRMHEQFPDRHFTVRNLSRSGETPRGGSRASFDGSDQGWERLKQDIARVRPTVVFLGFGMAASLQEMTDRRGGGGDKGGRGTGELGGDITLTPDPARAGAEPMTAARFKRELGELMDAIAAQAAVSAAGAAPGSTPVPGVGSGVPPERTSGDAPEVTTALAPDASAKVREGGTPSPTRETRVLPGIPVRFVLLSPIRHEDLRAVRPGLPDPAEHNKLLEEYSKAIEELARERGARFATLMKMAAKRGLSNEPDPLNIRSIKTDDGIHLTEFGNYVMSFYVRSQLHLYYPNVITRPFVPSPLRAAVIRKNELLSHQFRPANSTSPSGSRKPEQDQNAGETPVLAPLIEAAEAEIDRLKRPTAGAASKPAGGASNPGESASDLQSTTSHLPNATSNPQDRTSDSQDRTSHSQSTTTNLSSVTPNLANSVPNLSSATSNIPDSASNPQSGVTNPASSTPIPAIAGANSRIQPSKVPDFTVEDGYQIELWADFPLLGTPTQMNWDPQGRLWVCSGAVASKIEPGKAASGRILILEDPDHTGKATKSTIFADGLRIPTGVVPDFVDSGKRIAESGKEEKATAPADLSAIRYPHSAIAAAACYVSQGTELLYLRDTDGDGLADERRIVLSGFGTEDPEHGIHTLHWGPDGRLYFHQGAHLHSHVETPWGMVRLNGGGVFASDPRTGRVEVFARGLGNSRGQQEDDWGQTFLTDAAGPTGISWAFPGATFAPGEGSRRQMPGVTPGASPSFAGLELIRSPHFPAEWQGNAITCDFAGHRIVRFKIEDLSLTAEAQRRGEEGAEAAATPPDPSSAPPRLRASAVKSGYTTVEQPDLVRTTDATFRPIDVKLGPDGALYVADESSPATDRGDAGTRDHPTGRFWRISRKDVKPLTWEPLLGKTNEELLEKLLSKSAWEREQAKRAVIQQLDTGHQYLSAKTIQDWMKVQSSDSRIREGCQVARALRLGLAIAGDIGAFPEWERRKLAPSVDPNARAAVARMEASYARLILQDGYSKTTLAKFVADESPRVRLETMRTLARVPSAETASLVLAAALKTPENDPHYDFAAWRSINDLAQPWTDAIASGAYPLEGHEAQLAYGLRAIDPALAGATLSRLFAAGKVPVDGSGPWIELIGDIGGPTELQGLLDGLLAGYVGDCCETDETHAIDTMLGLPGPVVGRATAALLTAARVRGVRPAAHAELVTALFHAQNEIASGAIQLAGWWKAPDAVEKIGELLDSRETPPPLRRAAVDGLRALGGEPALAWLNRLTNSDEAPGTRSAALIAIAQVQLDAAVARAVEVLPTLPESVLLETWRGLLGVKGAADALAAKLTAGGKRAVASVAGAAPTGIDGAMPSTASGPAVNLPAPVLAAGLRAAREAGKPAAKLLAALSAGK
jgi:glucose/arabinose dehydrogenase/HEAT repeat protein